MALVSKAFGDIITFTRASTATYFDSAGVLQSAAIDAPRFDYDPATLAARGFLIEEARTNSIRNNTMQGAVAGTPGTAPTNWTISSPSDGVDANVIGTGTQNGITYIDVQFVGTSSTGATATRALFDSNTQIVAADGQTWTGSAWFSLVGGSLTNVSVLALRTRYLSAAGAELTGQNVNMVSLLTGTPQRVTNTFAATDATTAFTNLGLSIDYVNSSAVDFTLRIGLPQLELGAFATSVIPTTTTALTRSADVASVNTLSPWYNATEGTLYGEFQWTTTSARNNSPLFRFDDGTNNNFVQIGFRNVTPSAPGSISLRQGGGAIFETTTGNVATNDGAIHRSAGTYTAAQMQFSGDGNAPGTATPLTLPTVSIARIGASNTGVATAYAIWIRRLTYYPRALSSAELQTITA